MVPFQAESQKLADENDITEDAPVITLDVCCLAVCHVGLVLLCSKDLEIRTILDVLLKFFKPFWSVKSQVPVARSLLKHKASDDWRWPSSHVKSFKSMRALFARYKLLLHLTKTNKTFHGSMNSSWFIHQSQLDFEWFWLLEQLNRYGYMFVFVPCQVKRYSCYCWCCSFHGRPLGVLGDHCPVCWA